MTDSSKYQTPSPVQAVVCFLGIFLMIASGMFLFGISLHVVMCLCILWVGLHARSLGFSYADIRLMMSNGIGKALTAIYIFLLIGMVIAAYMQSGTIATLVFYGLNLLNSEFFLPAGFLLASLMSVTTGTSWGTVGTIGVVLIAIGETLGIPLPLVAGMVISGATFGDKLSPISDTTNLAAMSAETSLYRHITSMLYTTLPTFCLVLILFILFGYGYSGGVLHGIEIANIQQSLAGAYRMNAWVTLLPLVVMIGCSLRRYSPEVSMTASITTAILIAVLYQEQSAIDALNALWSNSRGNTGVDNIDDLLGRGGIYSMSWTLILSVMALAMGGILQEVGFLKVLLNAAINRIKSTTSLIATTISAGLLGNMTMGEAYITIILNSQLFRASYKQKQLDTAVLSRSVEEGATMTTGLVPWTTAGAFYTATLGIPVLEYAPYAFFNYLNPFVSVLLASIGFGLLNKNWGRGKIPE